MPVPRIIVPGATTAVTRRCNLRKAFLGPWHPLVDQIWLYSMAAAQERTDVAVHYGIRVVNHQHLTVTGRSNNLPVFTERFHGELSCALNALLVRERYDAPRELFDGREPHYMRLLDAPAQASHLLYQHLNCVSAGLVQRPEHMPGQVFDFELWRKGYIDVARPPIYFSDKRPERLRLQVTPPPLLYEAFGGDLDRLIYYMNRLTEEGIRAIRPARQGKPVKGAKAITRLHPWSEPATDREPGGEPIPTFRIGARGIVSKQANIEAARETRAFRLDHRGVRIARRDGDMEAAFPYGTYAAVVMQGAPAAETSQLGNLVTQPGPLLEDIQAELARSELPRAERRQQSIELIEEVQVAWTEEASEICDHAEISFPDKTIMVAGAKGADSRDHSLRGSTRTADAEAETRPMMVVRHRFDRRSKRADTAARRVVVLRDHRRGRPSSSARSNSDPPH